MHDKMSSNLGAKKTLQTSMLSNFSVSESTHEEEPPPREESSALTVSSTFLCNYDHSTTSRNNNKSSDNPTSAGIRNRNESTSIARHCTGVSPNPKSVKNNLDLTIFNKHSSTREESKSVINYLGNDPAFFSECTDGGVLRLGKLKGFCCDSCHAFLCSNSIKTLRRRFSERKEKYKQAIFILSSETVSDVNDRLVSNFMKIQKHDLSSQGLVIQKRLA